MELGVCMAAKVDDIPYAVLAESLGYTHVWVADSQMLWSDCYATLALVADRTSTIRVGTGVAVAGTRPATVTAASIATINRLAPGRTFLGIGAGNTAMRVVGERPLTIAQLDAHLAELRPLLRGEESVVRSRRGQPVPVRHLMPDSGFVAFDPSIPLHVSAFGPRSLGLAGAHGDGLITSLPPTPGVLEAMWQHVAAGASVAGRPLERGAFPVCALSTIVVLQPGERADSERVKERCGAFAIATLHYAYEQWRELGSPPPRHLRGVWDEYVALLADVPADRLHQRIHAGHNCWVVPEEERFLTAEVIEGSCVVGEPDQVVDRLLALEAAGLTQVALLPPLATKEQVLAEVAEHVLPRLR